MSKIILAGATGLIGTKLISLFDNSASELHFVARRGVGNLPEKVVEHLAPTEKWPDVVRSVGPAVAISCLGTTWKKSGQNEAAFRAVDLDLVLAFGRAAREAGATQMITVSSVGASSNSPNFYLRTKGEMEDSLQRLGFDRVDILRPGLLTGERGSDRRTGERLAIALSPLTNALLHGPLRRYRSIDAVTVAQAIAALVAKGGQGKFIHENDSIDALAG